MNRRSAWLVVLLGGTMLIGGLAASPSVAGKKGRSITSSRRLTVLSEGRAPAAHLGSSTAEALPDADLLEDIQRLRCRSEGNPRLAVDISCNTKRLGQDFNPDNEISVAVDPEDPDHLVAGSNDYFYRFRGVDRLVYVPTGFFTSFDGGHHWIDGQIPFNSGNNAGDPSPAFDVKHDVVLMAEIEFTSDAARTETRNGNIAVSRSTDGGRHFKTPVIVMRGRGPDSAEDQVFFDKEYLTVDNHPDSPYYGRAYLMGARFLGGPVYQESPIYFSYSDDGGRTWSSPREISGRHPSCTYQEFGGGTDCDEDQFGIPEVAADGTLYVHYINYQNEAEFEVPFDFDGQVMVRRSDNGGESFTRPVPVAQLEDGFSDMPFSVIGRQTVWGHQLRWTSAGTITTDPTDPEDVTVVFADRGSANPNATEECLAELPAAPDYDPCNAGPGSDTDVYMVRSTDGGESWSGRRSIGGTSSHQWFPWADRGPDGELAVAWDEDNGSGPADTFNHVLWVQGEGKETLYPDAREDRSRSEQIDISATHWAGQYVPEEDWPVICGPEDYRDPPVSDAEGKDCNVFHGDYTGLAVGSDGSINVVWTGLNRFVVTPQLDPYTGKLHDGYAQDAMFSRR
ncbi:MAG: glycoside hydrolase [Actinomycetota bacterium]|nr:glycoside hydrolase [Actinomycetota bacterium]